MKKYRIEFDEKELSEVFKSLCVQGGVEESNGNYKKSDYMNSIASSIYSQKKTQNQERYVDFGSECNSLLLRITKKVCSELTENGISFKEINNKVCIFERDPYKVKLVQDITEKVVRDCVNEVRKGVFKNG